MITIKISNARYLKISLCFALVSTTPLIISPVKHKADWLLLILKLSLIITYLEEWKWEKKKWQQDGRIQNKKY